jgi:6-pyruvoyl-tetrahydropterin synthase
MVELVCQLCKKIFNSNQVNPNQYPKYCKECLESGGKCKTCGKPIKIHMKFCSVPCREKDPKTIKGHKIQGSKMKGNNNPSRWDWVKEKIAKGITQSYIDNPELRISRGNHPNTVWWNRRYLDGKGNALRSSLELDIAQMLQKWKLNYEYEPKLFINGHYRYPDFKINNLVIEVCGYIVNDETLQGYKTKLCDYLNYTDFEIVFLIPVEHIHEFENIWKKFTQKNRHLDIISLDSKRQTEIFIENVDTVSYSHFLEWYDGACQQLHSHTSYIIDLYLHGPVVAKWVIDFKEAKEIAKKILKKIDHKVVVKRDYVTSQNDERVSISWKNRNMNLLLTDVCMVDFEPTCENITGWLAQLMLNEFKLHGVLDLGLSFREGIDKGVTHYVEVHRHELQELKKILGFHLMFPNLPWIGGEPKIDP